MKDENGMLTSDKDNPLTQKGELERLKKENAALGKRLETVNRELAKSEAEVCDLLQEIKDRAAERDEALKRVAEMEDVKDIADMQPKGGGAGMIEERGMPVPSEETPLPWKVERDERITDRCGIKVEADYEGFPETLHFIVHAANHIISCREIVRRLAEWGKKYPKCTIHSFNAEKEHDAIESDAAKLWDEMQAKGGGDE